MADSLFLYLPEFRGPMAQGVAGISGIGASRQREISTLDDMADEIGKFKELDQLVIFTHGFTGGISLVDAAYSLTDAAIAKAFAKLTTKVQHIRFEGCWVGEAPVNMAAFGRLLSAKDVSGFTWVSWTSEITINIPAGITAKDLSKFLQDQNYEKWLMPGSTTAAVLASMAKRAEVKKALPMIWYQQSLDVRPPYIDDNYKKLGRHSYGARADAAKVVVAAKNAKNSTAPTTPFEYVTVTL